MVYSQVLAGVSPWQVQVETGRSGKEQGDTGRYFGSVIWRRLCVMEISNKTQNHHCEHNMILLLLTPSDIFVECWHLKSTYIICSECMFSARNYQFLLVYLSNINYLVRLVHINRSIDRSFDKSINQSSNLLCAVIHCS